MKCKKCQKRGQTWQGSPPVCFLEAGEISENWNCATLNEIRDICYEGQELPYKVDYQYCEDIKYATINIHDVEDVEGLALWISWYKNRGSTDAFYILDDCLKPRVPTETELVEIINYFKK